MDEEESVEEIYFIGSILDKSEFYYRELMDISTKYITVVKDNHDLKSIDKFWKSNTTLISFEKFCKKTSKSQI